MKQYLNVLNNIITNGVEKESGRANMPNTIGISNATISHDMSKGFPLLTTKEMHFKSIVVELLWFLKGDTNIKYLVDNGCNIWNKDAYKWFLKSKAPKHIKYKYNTIELFIEAIKADIHLLGKYQLGDLGKVYGHQWRNQNGVDQIADLIEGLQDNPYSRYHIIDAWNKADFHEMALPPCHLLYQFICRKPMVAVKTNFWQKILKFVGIYENVYVQDNDGKFILDLNMYQRSCDTFLGVPFNIASMGILLEIIAKTVGMTAGTINWIGGDTHLYVDHIDQAKLQLSREPMKLPMIHIFGNLTSIKDIENLKPSDIMVTNYKHHSKIKAYLSVGI